MADDKLMLETLDAATEKARQAAEDEAASSPHCHAQNAFYDRVKRLITIEFVNGTVFAFPPYLGQGLENASEKDLADIEISPSGQGLHWENLDVDLDIPNLLKGIFGTRTWMEELGRKGGQSRSKAKQAASRENGKKGGRPKKQNFGLKKTTSAEIDATYEDLFSDGLED
ncbi:MAG: DUF2442 domain-containing protein [Cyanobacteria bacterium P01_F01_bin.150]